jgi:hypothetical protein
MIVYAGNTIHLEFDDAQALNIRAADYAFQLTREAAGLMEGLNGRSPRLYDLRHTFVCKRVTQWYEQSIGKMTFYFTYTRLL